MDEFEEPLKVGDYAIVIEPYNGKAMYWPNNFPIGTRIKIVERNLFGYPTYYGICEEWRKDYRGMVGCYQVKREEFTDIVKAILDGKPV